MTCEMCYDLPSILPEAQDIKHIWKVNSVCSIDGGGGGGRECMQKMESINRFLPQEFDHCLRPREWAI